jgi:hypothetical protein
VIITRVVSEEFYEQNIIPVYVRMKRKEQGHGKGAKQTFTTTVYREIG